MRPTTLQVDNFHDTWLVEKVIAPAYALPKSEILHEGSQV